jgi:hypothetical protein
MSKEKREEKNTARGTDRAGLFQRAVRKEDRADEKNG